MDFNEVIEYHERHEADITVVYKDYDREVSEKPIYHQCSVDSDGEVLST